NRNIAPLYAPILIQHSSLYALIHNLSIEKIAVGGFGVRHWEKPGTAPVYLPVNQSICQHLRRQ
ncbi:MAG: hypothetical protein ABH886_00870, partial [Candidatus Desantisbacteria bacterium]